MTNDVRDERTGSALLAASTELLERLNADESPLGVVSTSLAGLAEKLGVDQAMVAIDDAQYGRQVFCSGRRPLGDSGDLLWGPPRVRTEPPHAIDEPYGRLIVAAVAASFERARSGAVVRAPALPAEPARTSQPVANPDELVTRLAEATERSTRYGWGFTLVLMRFDSADDGAASHVETHLRASDTLIELGPRDLGILLPAASDDQVPVLLARVGQGGSVSTFCYGLATCPGDSVDPGTLLALAATRLRDAEATRSAPEVHALEPPKV
jgi:hypothetical protein